MEFLDEDTRPRVVFQSRPIQSSSTENENQQKPLNKPLIFLSISFSSLLLILSILFIENELFKSLLIWVSISFIVGPFAPSHITGGDIRVGQGPILEPLEEEPEILTEKRVPRKRSKSIRSEEPVVNPIVSIGTTTTTTKGLSSSISDKKDEVLMEEKEWNAEDLEILKKQMVKNPVGKPKRWEVIAEAFKGRHRVENVIKKAKEMGEKKLDDTDSYAQFLKNRKAIDSTRVFQSEIDEIKKDNNDNESCNGGVGWTAAEDIALLNALKAFPKDVAMRWEKIAAAVPGKTKAGCVKRVSDLKRDFRSSKAGADN